LEPAADIGVPFRIETDIGDDNYGTLSVALAAGDSAADLAADLAIRRIALARPHSEKIVHG
jgi:hypothetical protein